MYYYWFSNIPGYVLWQDWLTAAQAKEDAAQNINNVEWVITHHIGEVKPFDPLTNEEDKITYRDADMTAIYDLRTKIARLQRQIANHPSVPLTILMAVLILFGEFQSNVFFFGKLGFSPMQRISVSIAMTAANLVITAIGAALLAPHTPEKETTTNGTNNA
jgi:hypothetical protein